MQIALTILIVMHAIIHLFGFLKAFGFSELDAISQPISKQFGIIWLMGFVFFLLTVISFLSRYDNWWMLGILALIISQFLIIIYWKDAKYGTVLNLIILVPVFIAYSTVSFNKMVNTEITQMLADSNTSQKNIVTEQMITHLPNTVEKWLLNCGIIGKVNSNTVFLEQDLQMLMSPEQKEWSNATAQQYFTTEPPAFNWSVYLRQNAILNFVGRDKFDKGKGEMTIKLYAIIPIVNVKNNEKINQAALQRYLAEIVWFPSAALSPHITWTALNDSSANATLTYKGTSGSGIFYFDDNGDFNQFVAMRYKEVADTAPTEWTVKATKTEFRNGIKLPVESEVNWKLEDGNWTWLKLKIRTIEYNIE